MLCAYMWPKPPCEEPAKALGSGVLYGRRRCSYRHKSAPTSSNNFLSDFGRLLGTIASAVGVSSLTISQQLTNEDGSRLLDPEMILKIWSQTFQSTRQRPQSLLIWHLGLRVQRVSIQGQADLHDDLPHPAYVTQVSLDIRMISMHGKDGRRCVCCLCHEGSNGPSVCLANQLGDLHLRPVQVPHREEILPQYNLHAEIARAARAPVRLRKLGLRSVKKI